MWKYSQTTGLFEGVSGQCYAGHGQCINNHAMQDIHGGAQWIENEWVMVPGFTADDWGPLPCGTYTMNPPVNTQTHGPYVIWLTPDPINVMLGRSGFGIHGDEIDNAGKRLASDGCIVAPPYTRRYLWANSTDRGIEVVP